MKHINLLILLISFLWLGSCAEKNESDREQKTLPVHTATEQNGENRYAEPEIHKVPDTPSPKDTSINLTPAAVKVSKAYLIGKFNYETHPDFIKIEKIHTNKYGEAYLRKEAYEAFKKMYEAASEDGIKLTIVSATRDFDRQKEIWNRKWNGKYSHIQIPEKRAEAILEYSAMPCISRHHWGTDMDLNELTNTHFENGEGKKVYEWLTLHAHKYGFCQPYTPKNNERPHGYNEEKWHWSFLPLAVSFLKQYQETVSLNDVSGFDGAEVKTTLNVIEHYVGGINKDCKEY